MKTQAEVDAYDVASMCLSELNYRIHHNIEIESVVRRYMLIMALRIMQPKAETPLQ